MIPVTYPVTDTILSDVHIHPGVVSLNPVHGGPQAPGRDGIPGSFKPWLILIQLSIVILVIGDLLCSFIHRINHLGGVKVYAKEVCKLQGMSWILWFMSVPDVFATIKLSDSVKCGNLDSANPWAWLFISTFSLMTEGYFPSTKIGWANQPRANWTTLSEAAKKFRTILSTKSNKQVAIYQDVQDCWDPEAQPSECWDLFQLCHPGSQNMNCNRACKLWHEPVSGYEQICKR